MRMNSVEVKRSDGSPIGTSRTNALRKAKAQTTKIWRREWSNSTKTGGFAIANQIPPNSKPTKRFLSTPREVFGRLIQCRTNHAYTGEFRKRFFPNESRECLCGAELQTREHIIRECKLYNGKRNLMIQISRDIWLPMILGFEPGIQALTAFLATSGAFTRDGKERGQMVLPEYKDEPEVKEELPP